MELKCCWAPCQIDGLRFTSETLFIFKDKSDLTAPGSRVDQVSAADGSSRASGDLAVTGAISLRGLSPKGDAVMWPEAKKI